MTYGLINGQPINGLEGEGGYIAGVDLVVADPAEAFFEYDAVGATPLVVGDLLLAPNIRFVGADLVSSSTATGLYNAMVLFDGVDLAASASSAADLVLDAVGSVPLDVGPFRAQNGVDHILRAAGVDLVRSGLSSALADQPGPDVFVVVAGSRPLEIGDLELARGGLTYDAQSASPLEVGPVATAFAVTAGAALPLEIGPVTTGAAVLAQGAHALTIGNAGLRFLVMPAGLHLGRTGLSAIEIDDVELDTDSGVALDVGDLPPFVSAALARRSFPLEIGAITVNRGTSC